MTSIRHELWLDAPPQRVFELLSSAEGISQWWDKQTKKETPEGVVFEHFPGPAHGVVRFLVLESAPHEVVRWRCISTHPENTPAFEWTGTEIAFYLGDRESSPAAKAKWAAEIPIQTVLRFEHSGWDANAKYLPFCNHAWGALLPSMSEKAMEGDA